MISSKNILTSSKNKLYPKIALVVAVMMIYIVNGNRKIDAAVTITAPKKINVGDVFIVTVDFGTNVAAYDLLEVTYGSRVLENLSTIPLIEKYWFDTSQSSNGIRKKEYRFRGLKNGTVTIGVKTEGLVSANEAMDKLGNSYVYKTVVVGNGIEAGDINKDGYINSTDAAIVLDLFKNGNATEEDYLRGDMDGNNMFNSTDAAMILDIFKNSN